ncbi:MAG: chemotaxis protein CheX [Lacunisphaera sp.]
MPAAAEINEPLIREYITRAVSDVFKTMLGRVPAFVGSVPQPNGSVSPIVPNSGRQLYVVGTVGFIGEVNGLIYLYLEEAFAKLCTCQLLGMTEAELEAAGDEVTNDAIGELTNMTVGGFKNGLCDAGYPCKLTIPSILRGSNFSVEPISSATRHTFHFDSGGHKLVTDILLKASD